eukprot:TRINITY_DN54890_c0_g1_i1.p1 TRINITY_DN54890_c0_g1~~TRINITY_DN54890_c0_g1_i1.p1  ORF type:complete len:860 (-),score=90.75 TRINITY_DN54890_c0_g1_i1:62-2641(-)
MPEAIEVTDVCGAAAVGQPFSAFSSEAHVTCACDILGHWPTLSRYMAPHQLLHFKDPSEPWGTHWMWPSSRVMFFSGLWPLIQATAKGVLPMSNNFVDPFRHARNDYDAAVCQLVGLLASVFINVVSSHAFLATLSLDELLSYVAGRQSHEMELLVDWYEGSIMHKLTEVLRYRAWTSRYSPSLFGLLQWLSVLQQQVRLRVPLLTQLVPASTPDNIMHVVTSATSKLLPCSFSPIASFARSLRCSGAGHWRRLSARSARHHRLLPRFLHGPSWIPDRQERSSDQHSELCAATAWHEGKSASPVVSAPQSDGSKVTVVAASSYTELDVGAEHSLELLIFTEGPLLNGGATRRVLFCGQHVSIVPDTKQRRWFCRLPASSISSASDSDASHTHTSSVSRLREMGRNEASEVEVEAAVTVFFQQALLLTCPWPKMVNLSSWSDVILRAEPVSTGSVTWEVSVPVCRKRHTAAAAPATTPEAAPVASDTASDSGVVGTSGATSVAMPTTVSAGLDGAPRPLKQLTRIDGEKRQDGRRVAMCLQPAYDMRGMERSTPGLIEQHLKYHELLGFMSFSLYDYDGTFGAHPSVLRLLRMGTMRYYPRWPTMVSEQLDVQCNLPKAVGLTGSRSMAIVELTLTHCIWSYRGDADWVLLGAFDAFLAIGPSVGNGGAGNSCWPAAPERFSICCDGRNGERGAFASDRRCWEGGRSFTRCCQDFVPTDKENRPRRVTDIFDRFPRRDLLRLAAMSLGLCEFGAPHPGARNASLFSHLWRTPTCASQFYQFVRPTRVLTQNMEWLQPRQGFSIIFPPVEWARVLHLVNTHGSKLRCSRTRNTYSSNRAPCTEPDHGLRWAFPQLLQKSHL